jgi:hypothetical protein
MIYEREDRRKSIELLSSLNEDGKGIASKSSVSPKELGRMEDC